MIVPLSTFLIATFGLAVFYSVASLFRTASKRRSIIRQHSCKEPNKFPHKDLLGLDLAREMGKQFAEFRRLSSIKKSYEIYGSTYQTRSFGKTIINTIDPENLRSIYAVDFENYGAEPVRLGAAHPALGRNVFTADGPFWKHSRAHVTPIFTRAHVSDLSAFQEHVDPFIASIPRDGSPFDIMPLIENLFIDSAFDFLFGSSISNKSDKDKAEEVKFMAAFNQVQKGIGRRMFWGKLRWLIRDRPFMEGCRNVKNFASQYVQTAVTKSRQSLDEKSHERYIFIDEMAKTVSDPDFLRDNLLAVFTAGHESTGILLTNCLFLTSRRPDIWKKLREEVLAVQNKTVTFELLKSLRYLQQVINETLRLYPLVVQSTRMVSKDTVLPTGGGRNGQSPILVKKGWITQTNPYALHRSTKFYGEDAEEFKPERWEVLRQNWHYLPFSGGPRICPAQQLALTEASYILFRLLREFKENRSCDERPWTESIKLTASNRNGVTIALIPV